MILPLKIMILCLKIVILPLKIMIFVTDDKLDHYLAMLNHGLPIESTYIKALANHLNAEVVLGTVTNVDEVSFVCEIEQITILPMGIMTLQSETRGSSPLKTVILCVTGGDVARIYLPVDQV